MGRQIIRERQVNKCRPRVRPFVRIKRFKWVGREWGVRPAGKGGQEGNKMKMIGQEEQEKRIKDVYEMAKLLIGEDGYTTYHRIARELDLTGNVVYKVIQVLKKEGKVSVSRGFRPHRIMEPEDGGSVKLEATYIYGAVQSYMRARGLKNKNTKRNYLTFCGHFLRVIGNIQVSEITEEVIKRFEEIRLREASELCVKYDVQKLEKLVMHHLNPALPFPAIQRRIKLKRSMGGQVVVKPKPKKGSYFRRLWNAFLNRG